MLAFIRKMLQKSKEEKGFTLIELMVVVAILGILAAVAIPKFGNSTETAKQNRAKADLGVIGSAISMYQADNSGSSPASIAILTTTDYLQTTPTSPWGDAYGYDANEGTPYYSGTGTSSTMYAWTTTWVD